MIDTSDATQAKRGRHMENMPLLRKKSPVLLVGNFLSSSLRHRNVCEELAAQLAVSDWPVITTSSKLGRIPRLLDMITTVWRRRKDYAVAYAEVYSGPAFFWAEAVCDLLKLLNKPVILTLRGGKLPEFATRWPGHVRRLLQTATVVTTPSSYLSDTMKSYRADLQILPNALDLNQYRFRWRSKPRPRLIWLRAFHNIYNPSLAPRVLALLAGTFSDIQLTMVGPDEGDGSLQRTKQITRNLNVIDRLVLTGGISKAEVPKWMNTGDIFLNTTNVDNTPVSVIEAMACGLCVVSTNVGGIPYLLEHERDALLVPPNNSHAMATAVRRILTEPGLADRLSCNARKKAEQFDWSAIFPQWEALLTAVANEGMP